MIEEKKKVYIYPAKRIRRFGVFFADLFITLILGVLILEGLVLQIARPIISYSSLVDEMSNISQKELDLYYENEILYYEEDSKYSFSTNLETTSDNYISYLCNGNNLEYTDVINTYYVKIRSYSLIDLNKLIKENDTSLYFDDTSYNSNGTYHLKTEFVNQFKPNFISGDEMSENAKTQYDDFVNNYFLKMYSLIVSDIKINNLYNADKTTSFFTYENRMNSINSTIDNMFTISSIIAFILSTFILFFSIPFIDKKGRTIGEIVLKTEHIKLDGYDYLDKKRVFSSYLLSLISNSVILMFLPVLSINFSSLFSFSILVVTSVISLLYLLIDLGFLLFNQLNRSIKEFITHSLVVDKATMDEYYKEMNYGSEQ